MMSVGEVVAGATEQVEESAVIDAQVEMFGSKPILSPLVLQCSSCRTVVGDTCTVIEINSTFRSITLESIL